MNETAKQRDGETARKPIRHFGDLDVYQNALGAGLRVYELTKRFPIEERYALTDQARRSSRSVCANIAEAWRKRRYEAAFIAKLNDAYKKIIGLLVKMIDELEKWVIKQFASSPMNCCEAEQRHRMERATSPFRPFAVSPFRQF
jgi:four helix bundle protein